jgi:MerR family transcriptional regulator, light-induced transcriptional regulator
MTDLPALREAYLGAALDGDPGTARRVLDEAMDAGLAARDVYLGILQPALYEVGVRWERAEISVAQEHLATATTQSLMARLSERLADGAHATRRGRAVVACPADELHQVGSRMVADFLEADGWDVAYLGPVTPPAEVARIAARDGRAADVVALSAALPERLPDVAEACAALRALDRVPFVLVGGQAFAGDRGRARRVGADAFAGDAAEAVRILAERAP